MPRSAVDRVHEVYATSYRRLVGQLTGVTGDPVEAEDAVMEAFVRAVGSGRSFLAADNPEAWLRTVAVNVTRTRWRRHRFFRDVSHRLVAEEAYADLPARGAALGPSDRRRAEPPMNPTDFPSELQHEVAARAPQPGFDAVMDRADAHRRRRRTTIASGLAAAVVVAGTAAVAGGVVGEDGRSPEPASPAPSPWDGASTPDDRLPSDVVAVLDDDQLQLWAITGGEDGSQAALWRGCDFDPCRFAVVIRDGDDVFGEALHASFPTLTTVPGGWLVEDARGISRLSPSGDRSEIFDTGPGNSDVMAGDTAVPTNGGWRLLRGDKLVPVPTSPSAVGVMGAHVTDDGRLVTASSSIAGISVAATDDGRSWSDGELTLPRMTVPTGSVVLAGSGDHVAAVLLGDDPDGSMPVLGVQVSHDAGRTWIPTVNIDPEGGDRMSDMSSVAVAADGTTYVTTGSHHLVRIDEGVATPVQLSAFDSGVFRSGDDVCVVAERGRYDALLCSADGLTGWEDRPLPGLG